MTSGFRRIVWRLVFLIRAQAAPDRWSARRSSSTRSSSSRRCIRLESWCTTFSSRRTAGPYKGHWRVRITSAVTRSDRASSAVVVTGRSSSLHLRLPAWPGSRRPCTACQCMSTYSHSLSAFTIPAGLPARFPVLARTSRFRRDLWTYRLAHPGSISARQIWSRQDTLLQLVWRLSHVKSAPSAHDLLRAGANAG